MTEIEKLRKEITSLWVIGSVTHTELKRLLKDFDAEIRINKKKGLPYLEDEEFLIANGKRAAEIQNFQVSDEFFYYKYMKGSIEFSEIDKTFYGKLLGIKDLVTYEAESSQLLQLAFYKAVNDYKALKKAV